MVKILQKAKVGDTIRVKLEGHQQCMPGVVDALGNNSSGRLIYAVTCGCGAKFRLASTQLERVFPYFSAAMSGRKWTNGSRFGRIFVTS